MTARSARRWAELARELEFEQLPELRKQAEGWRTGLTALTGLLAVLAVLKGRDNLADLPPAARYTAIGLAAAAFLALLIGSVFAIRAAHGRPGPEILLGGQRLRRWTEQEVVRVSRSLTVAAVCCVAGVALATSVVAVTWLNATPPPENLVKATTTTDGVLCGELVGMTSTTITLRTSSDDDRTLVKVPVGRITTLAPTPAC